MATVVSPLLTILNQIKIFHWQTKSFAEHKSLDGAYEELGESIDEFIETYMGIFGRPYSSTESFVFSVENYQNDTLVPFVDEAIAYLKSFDTDVEISGRTDLLNIRDEMLGSLNKLKYLLTLK